MGIIQALLQCITRQIALYENNNLTANTQETSTLVTNYWVNPRVYNLRKTILLIAGAKQGRNLYWDIFNENNHQLLLRCTKLLKYIGEYPNKKPQPQTVCLQANIENNICNHGRYNGRGHCEKTNLNILTCPCKEHILVQQYFKNFDVHKLILYNFENIHDNYRKKANTNQI